MKTTQNTKWFTLVELVVVATILVILTSIWFYSYVGNLQDSRDSARKADIAKLSSALKLYSLRRWIYPNPWSSFNVLNNWLPVFSQGKMDNSVPLSTLDQLVFDPKTKASYSYSITANKQSFQIAWSLENADNPVAILNWDYSPVAVNVLPTIILAANSTADVEIWGTSPARNLFVFNWGQNNIPYDFIDETPESNWTSFENLLSDPLIEFWQNSDFRSCDEIFEAGKSIWNWEYQILDSTWTLVNTTCTWP